MARGAFVTLQPWKLHGHTVAELFQEGANAAANSVEMSNQSVTVVGGGFSGLFAGYYLARQGRQVRLLEKAERLGGLVQTTATPHGISEHAARSLVNCRALEDLCDDLGVSLLAANAVSKKRFIYRRGPRRVPLGPSEALVALAKFLGAAASRRLAPRPGETVAAWGERVLGKAAVDFLLGPALSGIYAGDASELSASLILGPHFHKNREKRPATRLPSLTVVPEGGMQDLVEALEQKLGELGVVVEKGRGFEFASAELSHPHVICVPLGDLPSLLEERFPELAAQFSRVRMLPIISVTAWFAETSDDIAGFGCLFTEEENRKSLGVLFNSSMFENRGPYRSESWILGGARSPEMIRAGDDEIVAAILRDRGDLLRASSPEPLSCHIVRYPQGLPYYDLELERVLSRLQLPPHLYLMGNYTGGIGLTKILDRARELAASLE
jgi:oxygen-dependent protoporphyrinogen oxidase